METSLYSSIEQWNLLNHPFYRAWNNGTLPAEKLKQYAAEYGAFISTISPGWTVVGEPAIAAEEAEHFEIWKKFAASLGVNEIHASANEVKYLVEVSNENYSSYSTALGCLFAFEAQQPHTTGSKKAGLIQHYSALHADETYFDIHMNHEEEPQLLLQKIEMLSPDEKLKAIAACERTCEALWNALSGIMGGEMCMN